MASNVEEEVIQGFITATKQGVVPGSCDAQQADQSDEKVESAHTGKVTREDDVTKTTADQYAGMVPVEEPMFMQDTAYETTETSNYDNKQEDEGNVEREIHGAQQLKQFLKQGKTQEHDDVKQEKESHENVSNKFSDIVSTIEEPTSANLSSDISNEPELIPIKEPEFIIDQVELKQKDEKSSNAGISYNETAIHYDVKTNTTEGSDDRVPVQEPVCVEEHAYVCTTKEEVETEIKGAQQLRKLLSQESSPGNDNTDKKEEKIEEEAFVEEVYEAKYEICKDAASAPTEEAVVDAFVTASKQTVASEPWIEQEKKDANETTLRFDEEATTYDSKSNTTQSSAAGPVPVNEPECVEEHTYVCGTESFSEQQSVETKVQGVQQLHQFLSQDQPPGIDKEEKTWGSDVKETVEEEDFTEEVYEAKYEICKDADSAPAEEAVIESFITASKQTVASQPPIVPEKPTKEVTKIPVQEPAFIIEKAAKKDTKSQKISKDVPESKAEESRGSELGGRVPVQEPECVEEHTYECTLSPDGRNNKNSYMYVYYILVILLLLVLFFLVRRQYLGKIEAAIDELAMLLF